LERAEGEWRLLQATEPNRENTMLAFIRNLVGVKTDQAVNNAVEAIVRWDPKSATEAELRSMEQHLDQLGLQVAEARQAYEREKREADTIQALSQQRLAAAEQLQSRAEAATDPAEKAALERSLSTLLTMLEEMTPEVEREKQDAADAQDFLNTLQQTYEQAGNKLKSARADLTRAQRDMTRADVQREAAERRAEAARQAAGLSGATSGLSVALKAMQDAAARDLAQAEAANSKAKLLTPTRPEKDDPNIAAAMDAAAGRLPVPTNLGDRLAAIRQKQSGPRLLSGGG
jgi:chromosome segregation ATPase